MRPPKILRRTPARIAFLAGIALATGQEPLGLWPLALAGIAVAFALWHAAASPGRALRVGLSFGIGAFVGALTWLAQPFLVEPWRHGWMIPFALLGMSFGLALFWALGFWLAKRLRLGPLGLVGIWGAMELMRGWAFTGFPWALPGYIWLDTPLAQLAALIGPYGLTTLTFLLAAMVWRLWIGPRTVSSYVGAVIAVGAFVGTGIGLGAQSLPADRDQIVHIVQPNAPQHLKWSPEHIERFFERAISLTEVSNADLVLWPETSVAALLDFAQSDFARIAAAARTTTVVGIRHVSDLRIYNSAVVLDADGTPTARYDKHHLVPFGEYLPMPKLLDALGLSTLTASRGYGFSAGQGPALLDLGPLGTALPLICYEAIFPRDMRSSTRPDFLMLLTNDAWFGTFSGPQQSLAQSRFRAIETGLPMLRAANTGISAVIDAKGTIRKHIELGQTGAIAAPIPAALPPTAYARHKEMPVIILVILLVLSGTVLDRMSRRRITPSN